MISLFTILTAFDSFFWAHIAFVLILCLGIYLSFRMKFFQIRSIPQLFQILKSLLATPSKGEQGIHPLKAFFASVGGMVGIGNIVGIVTAVQIGGPGALFWVWIVALLGSIIKYAEIFLGLKYRVKNDRGGYDGGPVYFLKAAFKNKWIPLAVAGLLCVYGVEVYQFSVLSDCLSRGWDIHKTIIIGALLGLVLVGGIGGIARLGKICSFIMPFFVLSYLSMGFWVLYQEIHILPGIFMDIFKYAFSGHAPLGGFAGAGVLLTIQHGVARSAYSSDLGIGYDSIIQSESSTVFPEKQASLAILGVFIDNFICTISLLLVLVSGLWKADPPVPCSDIVQKSLELHFPYVHFFIPFFILIAGYSTILAYFCVGIKCARFLEPKRGEKLYILYACSAFVFFSFFDQSVALLIMSISGALLLVLNLLGIFRLRKEISFPEKQKTEDPVLAGDL